MLTAACLVALAVSADPTMIPLLAELPEDGRWSKFDLRLQGAGQDQTLTWQVRSVGNFQQSGRDLRCIETELTGGTGDIPPSCHRMLVPIDAFGANKHALGETVRMWVKRGDDAPELFDSLSGDAITALFLAGITEDVKRQEKKETVEWQRGKLECDVFTGRSQHEIGTNPFKTTWTILQHKDVPFGLAGLRMTISVGDQGEMLQVSMTLQDFGKDAKATLPELTP